MNFAAWSTLILVFFLTSIVSVITGSTSLITVPVMFQLEIEPQTALATNMFVLVFMSLGATVPYAGKNLIERRRLPLLILLTLAGLVIGAALVSIIPAQKIPLIVAAAMIAVAVFTILNRRVEVTGQAGEGSRTPAVFAYALTFMLGIYGGFFSGGYVTILTAVFVSLLRMSYIQAIATTKVINVFSSLIAVSVFAWRGLIDYRLGLILAVTAFLGSLIGGWISLKINNVWLHRIFLSSVIILAVKTIFFDLIQ